MALDASLRPLIKWGMSRFHANREAKRKRLLDEQLQRCLDRRLTALGVDKETAPLVSLLRSMGYSVTPVNPYGQTATRTTVVDALRRLAKSPHWRIRIHGPPRTKRLDRNGKPCRDKIWVDYHILIPLPKLGRTPLETVLYRRWADGKNRVTITQLIVGLRGYVAPGTAGDPSDRVDIQRSLNQLEDEGGWLIRYDTRPNPDGGDNVYVYFTPPEGRGADASEATAAGVSGGGTSEGHDTDHAGTRLDIRQTG